MQTRCLSTPLRTIQLFSWGKCQIFKNNKTIFKGGDRIQYTNNQVSNAVKN